MPDETITFELIRKIDREEQKSPKLTKMPENFYQNIRNYLQQKKNILEKMEDRRASVEMKNIERLVEDIFNKRERKIITQAVNSARVNLTVENLSEEEKEFFNQAVSLIKTRREKILKELLEKTESKEGLETLVVFKEAVPEFVGSDMKTYGPFQKGDIAKLPEENMKVLLERGLVEEFKVSK